MAMSELKQKLLIYALASIGYPDAAYNPVTDRVNVQADNDRMSAINNAGDIGFGIEYSYLSTNTIRPLVDAVNESFNAWERANVVPFEDLKQFRVLAEYNNILLAARDDTELGRGFHFVTWRYNNDRTGLDNGFYTEDYKAAKENFATRSGLISNNKLFTQEQAAEIKAAIEYCIENNSDLTYAAENELSTIAAQLHTAYPAVETQEAKESNTVVTEPVETIASDNEPQSDKYSQLMERINKNLSDYHEQLEGFGSYELIDMASKIAAMEDAHRYLSKYHNLYEHELEYLLEFHNPLEVLADEWQERSIDLSDMSFSMNRIFQNSDILLQHYPVLHDLDAPIDTILRRYMDIDLELYLGKIAEKVIIHHPNDWKLDMKHLTEVAKSGDSEERRLIWHVCSHGTHLKTECDVFIKDTEPFSSMTDYRQADRDMFGFYIEVTGITEKGIVKGNVFEVGDYAEFAKHIRAVSEPLESLTLIYSGQGSENAGKTVTVSRKEYDNDRHRLMSQSGNVAELVYHPKDKVRFAGVIIKERAKRMAFPLGSTRELLRKVADKLAEVRNPSKTTDKSTETPKPKTLAEKMQAAGEKVKAQDEQQKNIIPHKREERE